MELSQMVELIARDWDYRIQFNVGKFGRMDRFVLMYWPGRYRGEVADQVTDPDGETLACLTWMDDVVKENPVIVALHINRRKSGGCMWMRLDGCRDYPKEEIAPIYKRRREEQERICRGELKRGHVSFGFLPMEGYC